MSITLDFTEDEIKIVSDILSERYGAAKTLQQADVELRLSRDDSELTERPALYWEDSDCHFLIAKLGPFQYHNQFFYRSDEQFNTGPDNYNDILDCVATLLKLQAKHQSELDAKSK